MAVKVISFNVYNGVIEKDPVIQGVVNGNITCPENSSVELSEVLNGTLTNDGGVVKVDGLINERLTTNSGKTTISSDAIVR